MPPWKWVFEVARASGVPTVLPSEKARYFMVSVLSTHGRDQSLWDNLSDFLIIQGRPSCCPGQALQNHLQNCTPVWAILLRGHSTGLPRVRGHVDSPLGHQLPPLPSLCKHPLLLPRPPPHRTPSSFQKASQQGEDNPCLKTTDPRSISPFTYL
jgi:hypothetical protein